MSTKKDEAWTEANLVRFTKKDMEHIKKIARQKGLGVGSWIRMIILDYLNKENK